jgi:hypothetical protein
MDIDISISVSDWSGSTNSTYTYTNTHITSGCSVKVNFLEGAESVNTLYIQFEKVVNGVRFTAPTKPTAAIPVRIHILNADATSTTATTASAVSTNAVSGAANVQDALSLLSDQIVGNAITVTNFNDVITSGTYQARATDTTANAPNTFVPGRWYNLSVFVNAVGEITQLAYNTSYGLTYIRGRTSGGSWSSWQELALNSKIAKYYKSQYQSDSVATNSNGSIVIPNPTGATTIKAIIPIGQVPADHWNCTAVVTGVDVATRTIYFRAVGSGNTQKYTIIYYVIYE